MRRSLNISVEGDFIHSFLYSGTLFLVGADSVVRTYNWEPLIADVVGRQLEDPVGGFEISRFLADSRRYTEPLRDIVQRLELAVGTKDLARFFVGELALPGWPADIYVYSNRLYTADERGVLQTPFSWERKRLEDSGQFKLLGDRAYSVSPNDANRVAIAAGINGVFSAAPSSGYVKRGDIHQILEVESYDCEWMNQILVANTDSGPHVATFQQIPLIPENASSDFWRTFQAARHSGPTLSAKLNSNGHDVIYAWLGGTKLFKVTGDGCLAISQLTTPGTEAPSIESLGSSSVHESLASELLTRLFSVRSASFGSVAEAGESLFVLSESGIEKVTTNPVSWRVFPRAKNYVNHLHVVQNDFVQIFAYLPSGHDGKTDLFGVDDGAADGDNAAPAA
jgi:hypothetical protein